MPAFRRALLAGLVAIAGCASPHERPAATDHAAVADSATDAQLAARAIRDYYAAIAAHDYRRAWLQWGDSGRASHHTLEEFTEGYAATDSVAVTVGTPGRVEGAAGSRFVTIPVTIRAMTTSGDSQHFAGTYVLRRVVVDGATPAQRRWHLFSATIHPEP